MNGTDAGRLDLTNTRGITGGSQNVTLTAAQMPIHNHTNTVTFSGDGAHSHALTMQYSGDGTHDHAIAGASDPLPAMTSDGTSPGTIGNNNGTAIGTSGSGHSHSVSVSIANAGGTAGVTQQHSNLQPTMVINYIIKH